jgi:hypothetical protein
MTLYDISRLSGDPSYAPGLFKVRNTFWWRACRPAIAQGYMKKPVKLPGVEGDDQDGLRRAKARDMCRDVLRWVDEQDRPKIIPNSWKWLIARYRSDEISPYRDVKANTRQSYDFHLHRWDEAIGPITLEATDYTAIKRWKKAMEDKGRSQHYIKGMFTMLRVVAAYGVMLRAPGADSVRSILSVMRFSASSPRQIAPTQGQIEAIIAKADEAGDSMFALGLSIQWWLTLRAVDVRGQMLDGRWQDGLTWAMVAKDLSTITKVPSKTEKSNAEPMVWGLSQIPDVRARLAAVPADERVGPVIKRAGGKTFDRYLWSDLFRRYREQAGVPDDVWMMDTRAGAINHAKNSGATPIEMQHAANHAAFSTTDRYVRGRNDAANKVIQLRSGTSAQRD